MFLHEQLLFAVDLVQVVLLQKGDKMDSADRNLATKARELSLSAFGVFPDIPFSFNSRLKRVLGRLVYSKSREMLTPLRIEISSSISDNEELLKKTLLHELSHFYLMMNDRDFSHNSPEFRKLSQELGFDIVAEYEGLPVHIWVCSVCKRTVAISFNRRRKNGLSSCCKAPIELQEK
ncbi:hypothetical protein BG32_08625 [Mesotoga sp. HF07.pep.5.2.highcov]|nr:SprT-like domain-containing protein [Thermotogota bacterium]MCP5460340.1 SprT-like domain-containing protein [Thermotogota bacterium]RLL92127.1 hypothetical protein BG32_08625 [Mesotoga sp. HF07.pep.5.2.highcov]